MDKIYSENDLIETIDWRVTNPFEDDVLMSCKIARKTKYGIKLEKITVLNRMTGFGHRDVETGYTENDGRFWLASGFFDIRTLTKFTVKQALDKVVENARRNVFYFSHLP